MRNVLSGGRIICYFVTFVILWTIIGWILQTRRETQFDHLRDQARIDIRALYSAAMVYEEKNAGRLPISVDDLKPYFVPLTENLGGKVYTSQEFVELRNQYVMRGGVSEDSPWIFPKQVDPNMRFLIVATQGNSREQISVEDFQRTHPK